MGWDAESSVELDHNQHRIKDSRHKAAFTAAAEEVHKIAGTVDCFLDIGGLDCSACCKMLQDATGLPVMIEKDGVRSELSN